ncbi:MAG TPA: hypothetical protein VN844_08930 [Pyrinomonadaceae bacterium]|nr:hypothetical protein [Pyrinomonadaceae bacterium]
MSTPEIEFRRNAVQPIQCIKDAWALIKDQYWLFVGICAVGLLVASAVPMGILMGPMMCGIYMIFFKRMRNEPFEFGLLFKGFDFFGPSLVATLVHVIPILIIVVPSYLVFYFAFVLSIMVQGNEPNPAAMLGVMAMFVIFWFVMIVLIIFISIGFTFSYTLIVDRKLQAMDAIKLSFKAAMANFWRILGMTLLTGLLTFAGLLLCYVGAFLVFPIQYGAIAVAYERVFGLSDPTQVVSNLPPPPPSF